MLDMARDWVVSVVIEPKPSLRDPEGETILRDLVHKKGWQAVKEVRAARLLRFRVDAENGEEAERLVARLCDELRLYNPISHSFSVWAGDLR